MKKLYGFFVYSCSVIIFTSASIFVIFLHALKMITKRVISILYNTLFEYYFCHTWHFYPGKTKRDWCVFIMLRVIFMICASEWKKIQKADISLPEYSTLKCDKNSLKKEGREWKWCSIFSRQILPNSRGNMLLSFWAKISPDGRVFVHLSAPWGLLLRLLRGR